MQTHRCIDPSFRTFRARALDERPSCIPLSKPKGAKAAGLRFERALHKSLPSSIHGQWFEFEDQDGFGYCQTDLLIQIPRWKGDEYGLWVVIEAKYTLVPGAHSKLSSLYIPVVQAAFGVQACGVVVVKNLDPRYRRGRIYTDIQAAAEASWMTGYPTLIQWSGQALMHPARSAVYRREASGTSEVTSWGSQASQACIPRPTERRAG